MRFIFKTDYAQDIKLAKHGGHLFWYGALCAALALAPWLLGEYLLAQLTFILIYGVVGVGLMLLAGFTGQFSIGHAAFFGVGAYTQAVLTGMGWPFPFALAAVWWAWADGTGLTKRREMEKMDERKRERREKNLVSLGMDKMAKRARKAGK